MTVVLTKVRTQRVSTVFTTLGPGVRWDDCLKKIGLTERH